MKNSSQGEILTLQAGRTAFVTFMAFISVAGALANAMVVLSVFINQNLRTKTNWIVLSLAVADFLVATVAIPLRLLEGINTSSTVLVSCNVVLAFSILFDGVSRLNIVLISFDRFMGVRFPFLYDKHASKSVILILIAGFWIVMGVFAICLISGVGLRDGKDDFKEGNASKICLLSSTLSKAAVMAFTMGCCLFPLLIVIPVNCYLVKKSHWHAKKIQDIHKGLHANYSQDEIETNSRKQSKDVVIRQRKKAKMVVVLVCLFVVLVAPITIIDVTETLGNLKVSPYLSQTAVAMIHLNTAVNVFVYAAFSKAFREAFLRIFVKCKGIVRR